MLGIQLKANRYEQPHRFTNMAVRQRATLSDLGAEARRVLRELIVLVFDFVELYTSSPAESRQINDEKQPVTNISFKSVLLSSLGQKTTTYYLQNLLYETCHIAKHVFFFYGITCPV